MLDGSVLGMLVRVVISGTECLCQANMCCGGRGYVARCVVFVTQHMCSDDLH